MALSKGTYQLVVRNIQLVNVGTLSVEPAWVAVSDGRIAYVGRSGEPIPEAEVIIDGEGDYLVPSLIDAHMHIESSFTTPRRFVEAALPAGTGTILSDPHEIANVAGVEGVDWIVRASEGLPMDIYFALPSCVPATNTELETPGADLRLEQLQELYARHPERFIALGEVMDFTALLDPNSRLHPILDWAKERRLVIDGHCPSLPPEDRQVYFSHGIMADHTITNPEKITSELAMGVWVQLQEKSVTQENVEALQKLPMEQVLLITDDYAPSRRT
ncbi:amidohydrolase family protein [Candidatus Darwinibacter acetoxidans]|jgi:adenine deaminase